MKFVTYPLPPPKNSTRVDIEQKVHIEVRGGGDEGGVWGCVRRVHLLNFSYFVKIRTIFNENILLSSKTDVNL